VCCRGLTCGAPDDEDAQVPEVLLLHQELERLTLSKETNARQKEAYMYIYKAIFICMYTHRLPCCTRNIPGPTTSKRRIHIELTCIQSNIDGHTSKKETHTSKTDTYTTQMKDLRKSKRNGSISAGHTHTHMDIERCALAKKRTGISVKKRVRQVIKR